MPGPGEPKPISLLSVRPAQSLKTLAQDFEIRHGPARAGAGQPESIIDRAARKLGENRGDFAVLEQRERKAALEVFWRDSGPWVARAADIEAWLGWAEVEWKPRVAETRVCAALLRRFDPHHPSSTQLGRWLAARQDQLWGRFGDFARRYRLFDGAEAAEKIGAALAADDMSFLRDIERNAHARILLQSTGFAVAVVVAFARAATQRTDAAAWSAADGLLDLFPRGLKSAEGPEFLRRDAKLCLISGVVRWAVAQASSQAREAALRLSIRLAGDPRENLADWRDIPEDLLAQIERWLVSPTLAAAFRIVETLATDEAAVLEKREKFWRSYLPHATRARLLGARKAQQAATRLGEPCTPFKTYLSDHCGFLLELQGDDGRKLVVVEMNNLAQTMFWPQASANAPAFGEKTYDGSFLRARCEAFLSHLPPDAWPAKFAELVGKHTGMATPP
jgi:hypothetical protein